MNGLDIEIPEDSITTAMIVIVGFIDGSGKDGFNIKVEGNASKMQVVGMMEAAKQCYMNAML